MMHVRQQERDAAWRAALRRTAEPANARTSQLRLIQSVDRALLLLETMAQARGTVSLRDLCRATGLNTSTCHHLLMTLAYRGYARQDARSREYGLGHKLFELSAAGATQIDIVRLAMPALEKLNEETGEAVHLAALEGRDLVTIARLDSRHAVKVDSGMIGKSAAAHATATGKAILAWLPEPEIRAILGASGMPRYTDNTVISPDRFIEQMALVRRHGYAADFEEFQPGVVCIGTAIRDHMGAVVASIGCSMPTMRAGEDALEAIRERVKRTANEVSMQLGARDAG